MDSATIDAGPKGFLSIFGSAAAEETAAPEADSVETPQDATSAADTAVSPDEWSADELVAARLAASLDDDGTESAETQDATADPDGDAEDAETHPLLAVPDSAPSLDTLTPEQLRVLAEEAIRLRAEASTTSRHDTARKVAAAEAAAVAEVQAAFEREVLAVSEAHYTAVFEARLADLVNRVSEAELPARAAALHAQVAAARQQYEAQQAEQYEERARQAALAARKSVPEMRQLYAAELVTRAGLPDTAVAEVLKVRSTDDFAAEVDKLVGMRDALLAERNRNRQQRRKEANAALEETTPRTATTGRPRGGKPPEYRGTAHEGARLLSLMRQP